MTNEVVLTPDFSNIFNRMIQDARNQGEASHLFRNLGLSPHERAEGLRAVQRFLAPLAIAANCMTTVEAVEQFREVITTMNTGVDTLAAELESETQESCTCDTGDCDQHPMSQYTEKAQAKRRQQ